MVFPEQVLDVLHTANVACLQQLPNLCSASLLFRTACFSAHDKTSPNDAPILHHWGGLHKIRDRLHLVEDGMLHVPTVEHDNITSAQYSLVKRWVDTAQHAYLRVFL